MTSRERVMEAFTHRETDRVPAWCGASPEFWAKAKNALSLDDEGLRKRLGDDFRRVYARWKRPDPKLPPGVAFRSPFGVERMGIGYGQPLSHPLKSAQTVRGVFDYPWPDPEWVDAANIRTDALKWGGEYAVLGGDRSAFWHDAIDLVGHDNLSYLIYDHPDVALLILKKIVDVYERVSANIIEAAGGAIDIFFIGNDFGSRTCPLLGVELFDGSSSLPSNGSHASGTGEVSRGCSISAAASGPSYRR